MRPPEAPMPPAQAAVRAGGAACNSSGGLPRLGQIALSPRGERRSATIRSRPGIPMDMQESAELSAFRSEVREWVQANKPADLHRPYGYYGLEDNDVINRWYKTLGGRHWLAYRWPERWGGPGFSPTQQIVFADELRACAAPVPRGFGVSMVGPLILEFGSDAQRERFLPPIAEHRELWCQGYSEPNAGSDLASLQTKAELKGDRFTVNGQKIWTSRANLADWIFALVRTSNQGAPQRGISFLLVDMKTPGVTIRPIKQIDGQEGFYETFFDNVEVPLENLVGKINEGWSMAKALLAHERSSSGEHVDVGRLIRNIKHIARSYERDGRPVLEDDSFRQRLTRLEMDADGLRYTRYRLLTALMQGRTPGPEASIFKLYQAELCQALYDLALEAMGPDAARWYDPALGEEAYDMPMQMTITRAMSIYAGSNEIQRNIIAKRVLGLPD
jgi:alkylation response protein AidB-like acyl-CoA dehydrogenase